MAKRLTTEISLHMQSAMQIAALSQEQLMAISGLTKPVIARWLGRLRDVKPKPIHVETWTKDKRGYLTVAQHRWGPGEDAPRPAPTRTAKHRMAAMRARRKEAA